MKKMNMLTGFVAGVIVTLIISVVCIGSIKNRYNEEISSSNQCIDRLTEYYNNKVVELDELQSEYNELETGIYNIVEGEAYDVTIHHDSEIIRYIGEETGGMFNHITRTKFTY